MMNSPDVLLTSVECPKGLGFQFRHFLENLNSAHTMLYSKYLHVMKLCFLSMKLCNCYAKCDVHMEVVTPTGEAI